MNRLQPEDLEELDGEKVIEIDELMSMLKVRPRYDTRKGWWTAVELKGTVYHIKNESRKKHLGAIRTSKQERVAEIERKIQELENNVVREEVVGLKGKCKYNLGYHN